ncbi:MAG: vWA domain-containing protein [Gemmataceae bacterium]
MSTWRTPTPLPSGPPRVGLTRLLRAVVAVLLALVALVYLLLWLAPVRPAALLIAYAGYEDNLAIEANPYGHTLSRRLAQMARDARPLVPWFGSGGTLRLVANQEQRRGVDWASGLDRARERLSLIVFALHGGADEHGAFFYPHDASADPADRLYWRDVLARLRELPASQVKLVLLDATANGPNVVAGQWSNRFAEALAQTQPEMARIDNLIVISASGPGERSWPAADGRLTLFGQHLLAELNRGERQSVKQLAQRLREAVARDAARLYQAQQTVQLLTPTTRAAAVRIAFGLPSPPEELPAASAIPRIEAAWRDYHATNLVAARAAAPGALRLWQAWLRRFEVLALANVPEADAALTQAEAAARQVRRQLDPGLVSPPNTLSGPALLGQTTTPPDPFVEFEQLWACPPEERAKRWQPLQGRIARTAIQTALIQRAAENPARYLASAAEWLRIVDDPFRPVRPAEAHYTVILARDLPADLPASHWDDVRLALQVRLEAEQTAFGVAPGYGYTEQVLDRPRIDAADTQRRLAQDLLLATQADQRTTARERLMSARAGYAQARTIAQQRRAALAALHRAWDELPAHLAWMPADRTEAFVALNQLEQTWQRDRSDRALLPQAEALQKALDGLQTALLAEADRATLRDDARVLAVPSLPLSVRLRLLEARERLSRRDHTLLDTQTIVPEDTDSHASRLLMLARLWAEADDPAVRLRDWPARLDRAELSDPALADRLARRLDAGQWQTRMLGATPHDPADTLRRIALADLLAWQAGRSMAEGFYAEDNTPAYRLVSRDYLRDAALLDPKRDWEPLRRQLDRFPTLAIQTPPVTRLLAGETRTIRASLKIPEGVPVLWAEPGPALLSEQTGRRFAQFVDGPEALVAIRSPELDRDEQTPPDNSTPRPTYVRWHGRYRGLRLETLANVWLHPVAESTRYESAPPRGGAVALRAPAEVLARYGSANGAVAIVLDCSGSTGPPPGEAMNETTRYRKLLRALRKLLATVPRGTRLSLWTFGQDTGRREAAEDTIRRAVDPVRWNGTTEQIDAVMSQVEGLRPWNESPIVRTMLRAKSDLLQAEGTRTLIVLTDGMDNRITQDKQFNPDKLPVPELLQAQFKDSQIGVYVVGFEISQKEEATARDQFAVLSKLTPPGAFVTVNKIDEVARAVERALRPDLRFRLVAGEYRSEAVSVAANGESDRWIAPPPGESGTGDFQLRTLGVPLEQRVSLGRGRALLLELTGQGERPTAQRLLFGREGDYRLAPMRTARDWRVSVLQNQIEGSKLGLFACLEKIPEPRESPLELPAPRAVWLSVESATAPIRWREAFGYPASCYAIDAVGWSATTRPRLRLWWSPDQEPPSVLLQRPADFRVLDDLPRSLRLAGESATLDTVALERRWIDGASRWCVVVRVSHAPDEPVQAVLEGMPPLGGAEHRWHSSADRYAGVFWYEGIETRDRLEDTIERRLSGLRLLLLGELRREASKRKYVVEFLDLDTPAATPGRPRAVFNPMTTAGANE